MIVDLLIEFGTLIMRLNFGLVLNISKFQFHIYFKMKPQLCLKFKLNSN